MSIEEIMRLIALLPKENPNWHDSVNDPFYKLYYVQTLLLGSIADSLQRIDQTMHEVHEEGKLS